MPDRPQPVDLLEFVGERGRQYVLPTSAPDASGGAKVDGRSRRRRRAEAKDGERAGRRAAARTEHLARAGIVVDDPASHADLAGDPDLRYVTPVATAGSPGRQRAWLVCVLLLAIGLPALVVTYGYNRDVAPAQAAAAPPTTATTISETTAKKLATTESTARATTTTAVEETTTSTAAAPTTSTTLAATTSTTGATTTTTTWAHTTVTQAPAPVAPVAAAAPPPTTAYVPPATVYTPPPTAAPAQGEVAFLACVRKRESGGNYGAVSPDGLYRGAYQFHQGTWDNTAVMAGRPDLVGTPPNLAGPADQDLLAVTLYRAAGARPWGGYCT